MTYTRRETLVIGAGGIALLAVTPAMASAVEEAVAAFTGGAAVTDGGVEITAPEIAENGNVVPIEVSAPGAEEIMVLATGNPSPPVCSVSFGPGSASQRLSTRIRLARTQDVLAMARMSDGSFVQATRAVKVTIGGCGG
ncbi:thiosulfate oxidation carrier protein SoxY [Maritimibacter sp. HL-12]|uniref:thiosulfate oxidation carrier protein SoxY n=1 Tax=Maritimibacter sp. HL-12 TaxID=1162418 RepID=UPI000A1CCD14|nr:thiosulfate oxidation carrier protein SoxY [Maritimibacter sp. HL-12]